MLFLFSFLLVFKNNVFCFFIFPLMIYMNMAAAHDFWFILVSIRSRMCMKGLLAHESIFMGDNCFDRVGSSV